MIITIPIIEDDDAYIYWTSTVILIIMRVMIVRIVVAMTSVILIIIKIMIVK